MLKRYRNGVIPPVAHDLAKEAQNAAAETCKYLEQNQLQAALQAIWALVDASNKYIEVTAPFKLPKDSAGEQRRDVILYSLAEACRILAVLLWPFVPSTSRRIYSQLGLPDIPDKFSATSWGGLQPGHSIGTPAVLFPKKET
jgi:methionyl-tRNA synthetase